MLVLDRVTGRLTDSMFRDLPEFLRAGDLLVLNDSRVLPARLFATRAGLSTQANSPAPSGVVEVLLTEQIECGPIPDPTSQNRDVGHPLLWRALVKPARKVLIGETLHFGGRGEGSTLTAEVIGSGEFGERTLRFAPVGDFYGVVGRIGHMPLPPYIHREQAGEADSAEDRERYQTVYSHEVGSAAAPTAGLHFTPEILAALADRGVEIQYVTLHVGLGTFQPVRVSEVKDVRLHAERYTLSAATADALNRAIREGRRVIAVGTTTTRTLEHIGAMREGGTQGPKPGGEAGRDGTGKPVRFRGAARGAMRDGESLELRASGEGQEDGTGKPVPFRGAARDAIEPHSGSTSIFISPGYRFRIVSGLLTNFHLPESTLLMLVAAFAQPPGSLDGDGGRQAILGAYGYAVRGGYRFYSYGDCMLLV